ncbi:MAG: tail fiber protein [Devosia nanyangense]|uniref:Tail fiber protein n=1 Tax=Devosia nanyangense TaxID=1228055 RepID=A0A933L072_9HYPH|nr:tail fiber protein [Devosia nanyangense]
MLGAGGGFSSAIPIGGLIDYGGTSAPDTCWVFPYGEALSRTTYAALFAVLSTTYGVGDGSTTFNVMDLRGRVTAGQDDMGGTSANRLIDTGGFSLNGDTLGDTGGAETHTLTEAEMPSHTHSITKSFWHGTNGDGTAHPGWSDGDTGGGSVAFTTTSAGGDDPHDIVQPTIILNKLLRAC